MRLILFRHGIAEEGKAGEDAARRLTSLGKKRIKKAALGLDGLCNAPSLLVSSPLVRSQQTAEILSHQLKGCDLITNSELAIGGDQNVLVQWLSTFTSESEIVCVGHEPDLSLLAAALLGLPHTPFSLGKGGACCIEFSTSIKLSEGRLLWLLTPRQLRRIGA